MKIGIDVDDVLANFTERFVTISNQLFDKPALGTLPTDWNWSNLGLTKAQIDLIWRVIKGTYNFWTTLNRAQGAKRSLDPNRFTSFYITSRVPTEGAPVTNQTASWLQWNLDVEYPTVIVASNKGPIAKALGLDAFIDDRVENCIAVKAAIPSCRVFLKNASHNSYYTPSEGIERVGSFDEFCARIG